MILFLFSTLLFLIFALQLNDKCTFVLWAPSNITFNKQTNTNCYPSCIRDTVSWIRIEIKLTSTATRSTNCLLSLSSVWLFTKTTCLYLPNCFNSVNTKMKMEMESLNIIHNKLNKITATLRIVYTDWIVITESYVQQKVFEYMNGTASNGCCPLFIAITWRIILENTCMIFIETFIVSLDAQVSGPSGNGK